MWIGYGDEVMLMWACENENVFSAKINHVLGELCWYNDVCFLQFLRGAASNLT